MLKEHKRQIAELIGVATVVISLIFVGMQLLLDRRVATAEQFFNRAEAQRENLRTLIGSEEYYQNQEALWDLGQRPNWWSEDLETAELMRTGKLTVRNLYFQILEARISILGFDSNYFQYQQGLLQERVWQGNRQGIVDRIELNEINRLEFLGSSRYFRDVVSEIRLELGL